MTMNFRTFGANAESFDNVVSPFYHPPAQMILE